MNQTPQVLDLLEIKKKLGRGAYATVYLAQDSKQNLCAIKMIDNLKLQEHDGFLKTYFEREVKCMREVDSQNVVKLLGVKVDSDFHYMIMEYCENGNLSSLQASLPDKVFSVEKATFYLSQVIIGLEAIHEQSYIHRDLKLENILLRRIKGRNVVKIADFGFATKRNCLNDDHLVMGTDKYISPEVYQDSLQRNPEKQMILGFEVDIWAFGVLFFFMLNQSYPFQINHYWEAEKKYEELVKQATNFSYERSIKKSKRKIIGNCSCELQDFFKRIFEPKIEKRMTFFEIRQYPIFSKYFPDPSPSSIILYSQENQTGIKNKIKSKISEVDLNFPLTLSDIHISGISPPDCRERDFTRQIQILDLELQEIDFIWDIMEEFMMFESEFGAVKTIMFCYSLTRYYQILLTHFVKSLKTQCYQQKYPEIEGLKWKDFFLSKSISNKLQYNRIKLNSCQVNLSSLEIRYMLQKESINQLHPTFHLLLSNHQYEDPCSQQFSEAYRKSTNIMYQTIRSALKERKLNDFYFCLCAVCICHVFQDFRQDQELKNNIFSTYIAQETLPSTIFSFGRFNSYLRGGDKGLFLELAKKILQKMMAS